MTKEIEQQIFDQVTRHLITQGERSEDSEMCLYRHGNLKCAVGCLITDQFYDAGIEGSHPRDEVVRQALRDSLGTDDLPVQLLAKLQHIHDYEPPGHWIDGLAELARDRGLSPAVLYE